jgi:hypothetical protein
VSLHRVTLRGSASGHQYQRDGARSQHRLQGARAGAAPGAGPQHTARAARSRPSFHSRAQHGVCTGARGRAGAGTEALWRGWCAAGARRRTRMSWTRWRRSASRSWSRPTMCSARTPPDADTIASSRRVPASGRRVRAGVRPPRVCVRACVRAAALVDAPAHRPARRYRPLPRVPRHQEEQEPSGAGPRAARE